ncbi:MAG: apolipoprotein N-acyltransferase, partial [Chloroflexales bacterium]|nr:apolipoprotein N-acyltransferase [Chloroflexales bacterium]
MHRVLPRPASPPMARPLLTRLALSALSGILLALAMPGIDLGWLAWVALVPLLIAIDELPAGAAFRVALPFSLVWAISAHRWYPFVLGPTGLALMPLVGVFHAGLIRLGVWLRGQAALHTVGGELLGLLALPLAWTAGEFLRFAAPVTGDWWFALLANSQWRNPPALQVITLTGTPGLAFTLMLANVALARLVRVALRRAPFTLAPVLALAAVGAVVGWGALTLPPPPADRFTVAVTVDLANTDPAIQASGEGSAAGYRASTPAQSQAIFDVNAALTRSVSTAGPAFVVWPEHEIADIDDPLIRPQLAALARELQAYLVVDTVWQAPTGMHDTALLIGPDGAEVGRQAKVNITDGER